MHAIHTPAHTDSHARTILHAHTHPHARTHTQTHTLSHARAHTRTQIRTRSQTQKHLHAARLHRLACARARMLAQVFWLANNCIAEVGSIQASLVSTTDRMAVTAGVSSFNGRCLAWITPVRAAAARVQGSHDGRRAAQGHRVQRVGRCVCARARLCVSVSVCVCAGCSVPAYLWVCVRVRACMPCVCVGACRCVGACV